MWRKILIWLIRRDIRAWEAQMDVASVPERLVILREIKILQQRLAKLE